MLSSLALNRLPAIAADAYTFGYPLVLSDTIAQTTVSNRFNRFVDVCDDELQRSIAYDAKIVSFVAWIDIEREPAVVSFPRPDRYYCASFIDGWANALTALGSRVTGVEPCELLVVGPNSRAACTPLVPNRIESTTSVVRVSARAAFYSEADLPTALEFRAACRIAPLSRYAHANGNDRQVETARVAHEALVDRVERMSAVEYFSRFSSLLSENHPLTIDKQIRDELIALGLDNGRIPEVVLEPQRENAEQGMRSALARIQSYHGISMKIGDWSADFLTGCYGRDYLRRAAAVRSRFFSDLSQDCARLTADVDAAGDPLDGRFRYRLSFNRGNEPPARGPWFVGTEPLLRANGSAMSRDSHGTISIRIQNDPPDDAPASHWLPTSEGPLKIVLHVFWPGDPVLNGRWIPPVIERVP